MLVVLGSGDHRSHFVQNRGRCGSFIATSVVIAPLGGGEGNSPGRFYLTLYNKQSDLFMSCIVIPCSELFDDALSLLCCRQLQTKYFFAPTTIKLRRRVFVALLLLMAGVQPNPRPQTTTASTFNMGLI